MNLSSASAAAAILLALSACGGEPGLDGLVLVGSDPSDAPLEGLTAEQQQQFAEGDALFEQPFREAQGLGPVYIRFACASCHAADGRGPGAVTRMAIVAEDGVTPVSSAEALPWGSAVRPQLAGGGLTPVVPPEHEPGLLLSTRQPPPVFGRGYLEAITNEAIEAVARAQAEQGGVVSGRINYVPWQSAGRAPSDYHDHQPGDTRLIGRFGLKARIATLDEFTADAFQGDMSITSPLRPDELPNPDGLTDDQLPGQDIPLETVDAIAGYMRMLAIPQRQSATAEGAALFEAVGCADCHVPYMRTRADYPIPPIAGIDAPVYTDLLLHDMGALAADGIEDFGAMSTEWRTPALMGLRFLPSYMHDGRASTVQDAIEAHDGPDSEGREAVAAVRALNPIDREHLMLFVEGL